MTDITLGVGCTTLSCFLQEAFHITVKLKECHQDYFQHVIYMYLEKSLYKKFVHSSNILVTVVVFTSEAIYVSHCIVVAALKLQT